MVIILGKRGVALALALFFMLSGCGVDNSTDPVVEPSPVGVSPETGAEGGESPSEGEAPQDEGSDDSAADEAPPAEDEPEPSEPTEFSQTTMINNIGENVDQLADGCDVALTNQATVQVRYVDAERCGQSVNDELCVLLVVLGVLGDADDPTHPHAEHCFEYGDKHRRRALLQLGDGCDRLCLQADGRYELVGPFKDVDRVLVGLRILPAAFGGRHVR